MEPRNRLQGMNSANLCSLAGRYDNFILVPSPHILFKNSSSALAHISHSKVRQFYHCVIWASWKRCSLNHQTFKGTVSRVFFGRSECFNENRTFCACADGFQGLSKASHYPIQISTFYLLLLICKFLMKPSSKFSSLWLVDNLRCRPLIGCRENAQEIIFVIGSFRLGWPRKFRETKFRGISCYFYFVFSRKFWENFRGMRHKKKDIYFW